MFEMSRTLLTVVAVWSLVASPGLCRGGWLTACCEHETTIGFSAGEGGCEDPDCRCPVKEHDVPEIDADFAEHLDNKLERDEREDATTWKQEI